MILFWKLNDSTLMACEWLVGAKSSWSSLLTQPCACLRVGITVRESVAGASSVQYIEKMILSQTVQLMFLETWRSLKCMHKPRLSFLVLTACSSKVFSPALPAATAAPFSPRQR